MPKYETVDLSKEKVLEIAKDETLRRGLAAYASAQNHREIALREGTPSEGLLNSASQMSIEYYLDLAYLANQGEYPSDSNGLQDVLIERWVPGFLESLEEGRTS